VPASLIYSTLVALKRLKPITRVISLHFGGFKEAEAFAKELCRLGFIFLITPVILPVFDFSALDDQESMNRNSKPLTLN